MIFDKFNFMFKGAHVSQDHIGVFDSGIGGLTVVQALYDKDPNLSIRYFADTKFFPYGDRAQSEITDRVIESAQVMVKSGCQLLIIACNTACSAALEHLREYINVPVVGIEPPLNPAAQNTISKRIVILATEGTVSGDRLARLEADYGNDVTVDSIPMPGLADMIESGDISSEKLISKLKIALRRPISLGADALALGCTHYGFLSGALNQILPKNILIFDPADAVARRALALIKENRLLELSTYKNDIQYQVSGSHQLFNLAMNNIRASGGNIPPMTRGKFMDFKGKLVD